MIWPVLFWLLRKNVTARHYPDQTENIFEPV
jgi:hypothetical protein